MSRWLSDGAAYTPYCAGLSSVGVPVSFCHHTLPEYLDAFLAAGLHMTKLVDVDHPSVAERRASGQELPLGDQLPRFMVLAVAKA